MVISSRVHNFPPLKDSPFYVMEELPNFLIVLEKYFQLLHDLLVYFRTVDIHPHSALKLLLK